MTRAIAVTCALAVAVGAACGRKTNIRPPELVAPKTVSELALTSTPEGVMLRWSRPTETVDGKSMDDLAGFVIERAVSAVGFREIARVPVTDRGRFQKAKRFEYLDREVVPGAVFHYRVVAFTTDQYYSAPSGAATITWATPVPTSSPTGYAGAHRVGAPQGIAMTTAVFDYRADELACEGVSLARIAAEVGTPAYVYSLRALREAYQAYDRAFAGVPHLVCYAIKANDTLAVLRAFAREGSGFDIVSGGELFRALRAGGDPRKIVFAGVGKTREEMRAALDAGILMFNVESEAELAALEEVAAAGRRRAPVSVRVNPDVDPKTHPYISTGMKKSKFGIDITAALAVYEHAARSPHLDVIGVDCHIGSQLTSVSPFVDALARVRELVMRVREHGTNVRYLDVGGGVGITYHDERPPSPQEYAQAVIAGTRGLDVTLIIEPGRSLVGNAGALLTRVLYLKQGPAKRFVVIDAAMNDLIRPALYGAYQDVRTVARARAGELAAADLVGPVCESADFLAQDRPLPPLEAGDLLAVMSAGAYGFVMASNYNARPRPAVVLVDGDRFDVIRARETIDDLIRGETIPSALG